MTRPFAVAISLAGIMTALVATPLDQAIQIRDCMRQAAALKTVGQMRDRLNATCLPLSEQHIIALTPDQPPQPACTYGVTPLTLFFPAGGGIATVQVTTQTGCAWAVATNQSWLANVTPTSATGSGLITLTVKDTPETTDRTGLLTVAGGPDQTAVAITQTGLVIPPEPPTGFAAIVAGIRPRGFGATPYVLSTSTRMYYVALNGSDLNAGSSAAPFRTISKAAQVAVAGDVITIGNGTYTESVSVKNGGTALAPIVFQAANRGGVILSGGTHVFGPSNWTGGLQNTGAIYVTVKGLVFRNYAPFGTDADALRGIAGWRIEDTWFDAAADNAVNLRGDNIVITRTTFTANNRHAIVAWGPCGTATGPDQLVGIKGLIITDNVIRGNNPSTVQPPAGSGSAVVKILASKGALIENNESGENYGPGLWLDSCNADYLVQYNYLHDNIYRYVRARGLDIEISWRGTVKWNVISGNANEGLNINNTSGLLVENNLFNHNRRSIVITAAARGTQFPCRDNMVRNNQFRDWFEYAAIEGLIGMTAPAYPGANNVVVDYNTYQPMTSNILSGWWGYFINTLATNCANIGWECHGKIGTIPWPPQ